MTAEGLGAVVLSSLTLLDAGDGEADGDGDSGLISLEAEARGGERTSG